jgi:3-methyladenine DNA glycosylase AlkC
MADALKLQFNETWLLNWVQNLCLTFDSLDKQKCYQCLVTVIKSDLSLMQIIKQASALSVKQLQQLGYSSSQIRDGILTIAPVFSGLQGLVLPQMIEDLSDTSIQARLDALGSVTAYSSSEFAMRNLIAGYPEPAFRQLLEWSQSADHHQRRLASEACRPRLPWAKILLDLKLDPSPILPILNNLMQDTSLYVRKSVANNLNDIGKDHPEKMLAFCVDWKGKSPHTDWIIKQACRNFLKQRDPRFLALFNLTGAEYVELADWHHDPTVKLGEQLAYQFTLRSEQNLGYLRVEIQVDYVRPNRPLYQKVFKLIEADYVVAHKKFSKRLSFKRLTTRRYYPGQHQLQLIVNGVVIHQAWFEVVV